MTKRKAPSGRAAHRHLQTGCDGERLVRRRIGRRGATFLEYALLAALIGIVGAVGVMKYGKAIYNFFDTMAEKTNDVTPK